MFYSPKHTVKSVKAAKTKRVGPKTTRSRSTRPKAERTYKSYIRSAVLAGLMLVLVVCGVSSSLAYLSRKTAVKNTFAVGNVQPEIIENFDPSAKTKSDVAVKNQGNVPVYIRAAITVYWQDVAGNILSEQPAESIDYTIELSSSQNWVQGADGYYYYKQRLAENASTDILLQSCRQIKPYADRTLVVDIAAQSIQANPPEAVTEAWDVTVDGGKILPAKEGAL